ncbi:AraC family transcriptional regulator [Oscillatoria sp. CS-180]|uniref:AraC family transcriptional regulator n=1 Tax=Oscillatoria sp. CS-180 TaxID=3021720 RepID=UPI00232C045F|nr:AraC family transcriptional regulator [Oscillatoria sp. CS-180]MDB9524602.1 AraC family transcriptional regulator [Oscillatoria sp. CS-180]
MNNQASAVRVKVVPAQSSSRIVEALLEETDNYKNYASLDLVPSVQLCSKDMTIDECLATWTEVTKSLFNTQIRNPDEFSADFEAYRLKEIVFIATQFKAQVFNRTVGHTRSGAADHLVLEVYLAGSGTGCLGDDFIAMSPYQVNLFDYRKTLFIDVEDASLISFVIPKDLVRSVSVESFPTQLWHTRSPQGRLLVSTMKELRKIIPETPQENAEVLSHALVGLINGLMSPKPQRTTQEQHYVQSSTLQAMKEFIQNNLHQPELDTQQICTAFHCSRATVYRCFKEESGVEGYIRSQRLKRAFSKLSKAQPGNTKMPIYSIALASGFTDPAHFSRLFKRTFGITPSEVLYSKPDQVLAAPVSLSLGLSNRDQIEAFRSWLG